MWKNTLQPDRPQRTIRLMRISGWIPKARNTHSRICNIYCSSLQQLLNLCVLMLRYTYIACLVLYKYQTLLNGAPYMIKISLISFWTSRVRVCMKFNLRVWFHAIIRLFTGTHSEQGWEPLVLILESVTLIYWAPNCKTGVYQSADLLGCEWDNRKITVRILAWVNIFLFASSDRFRDPLNLPFYGEMIFNLVETSFSWVCFGWPFSESFHQSSSILISSYNTNAI